MLAPCEQQQVVGGQAVTPTQIHNDTPSVARHLRPTTTNNLALRYFARRSHTAQYQPKEFSLVHNGKIYNFALLQSHNINGATQPKTRSFHAPCLGGVAPLFVANVIASYFATEDRGLLFCTLSCAMLLNDCKYTLKNLKKKIKCSNTLSSLSKRTTKLSSR